jgi:hypothetical protein
MFRLLLEAISLASNIERNQLIHFLINLFIYNLKRWIYNKVGCEFAGFVMYSAGCIHLLLMVAISLLRYL